MMVNTELYRLLVLRSVLMLVLAWPVMGWGQTVIFSNGGRTYTNTKSRTSDTYNATANACASVNFSVDFRFSLGWGGSGNLESNDECPGSGGCSGDPDDPAAGGCTNCWDFIWVLFFVDGAEVHSDLIGAGNNQQSGTISISGVPVTPGAMLTIEIFTQTWASDESVTFNNIRITGTPSQVMLNDIGPFCSNRGNVALANNQNGVTGVWSGPGVTGTNFNTNTAGVGTHTLTFTPNANQCATPNTIDVQVDPAGPAVLDDLGPYCQNSGNINLPTNQNGINGNWSGTNVSSNRLSTTVVGTKNLTFTPSAGQCATPATTTAEVTAPVSAVFSNLGPYCQGQGIIQLPTTDDNGTTGGWTGTGVTSNVNLNTGTGGTGPRTLRFTPGAGQCAVATNIPVTINPSSAISVVTPGPFCTSPTPVALNTTQGGQAGNWSGTGVSSNRLNISTAGAKTLTFTPTDPCFSPATITVNVGTSAAITPIPNQTVCGSSFKLPAITATTSLDGTQAYYTGPSGTGTKFAQGAVITSSQTLFAYYNSGGCSDEKSFTVTFQTTPKLDSIRDTTICGKYTLPIIKGTNLTPNAAYYTKTRGGGTRYLPGQSIDTAQILFAYDSTATGCFDQDTFKVNIVAQPRLDTIVNVQVCSSYTLPTLKGIGLSGNQAYYSAPNGGGTKYLPGQSIAGDIRLYAFDRITTCTSERTFLLDTLSPPILDPIRDTTRCGSLVLPPIRGKNLAANTAYYTQSLGAGLRFSPGQNFSNSQTLFVYSGTATCFDQDTFLISIVDRPSLDSIADVQICGAYTLPPISGTNLSGNQAYYTAPNGGGTKYTAGQTVSGDLRLYAFDQVPGCFGERSFLLDTLSPPQIDSLPDTTACGSLQLPLITGKNLSPNVAYYGGPNGTGTRFLPGQTLSFSGNFFMFDQKAGCSAERLYRVSITPGPRIELGIKQPISCNGSKDGELDLKINNSLPPVNIRWNQTSLNGTEDPANLGPGTYTVTVTDGTACDVIASITLIEPTKIALTCTVSKAVTQVGGTDGEARISINGGTARYKLSLSGPVIQLRDSLRAGTTILTGLSTGTYQVLVTDSLGCQDSCQFTIIQPNCTIAANATSLNPTCNGANNGQIDVSTTGGEAPLSIDWNQNALDGQFNPRNLGPGRYSFIVTDNVGCRASDTIVLTQPAAVVLSCAQQSAVTRVGGNNGAALITTNGGTRPYRISWSGKNSGSFTLSRSGDTTITGLSAGQYRIVLRDQNGCVDSCLLSITEPVCAISANIITVKSILCNGDNNGVLTASVRNGQAPYTYRWSNGAGSIARDTLKNLGPGTYTLILTDNLGCADTAQINLTQPSPIVANCQVISDVTTVGGRDGGAKLKYTGGTGTIALDWGGSQPGSVTASGRDSISLGSLPPGTYSPNFIDVNGCRTSCSFTVREPVCNLQASLSTKAPACQGEANGQVIAIPTAGVAPYSFQWSNGGPNKDTLSNLAAGNYQVTITDAINCRVVLDTVLRDPAALTFSCQIIRNVITVKGNEGIARVSFSGGVAPYFIRVQGPVTSTRTEGNSGSVDLTGWSAGDYTVIISDINGCQQSCSFSISEPNCNLALLLQGINPLCNGAANGQISVAVNGGKAPFKYDWSDNTNDGQATARNLRAGTYTVVVSDSIGCAGIDTLVLAEPSALRLTCGTPVPTTTVGGQNGRITVRFSGGTGPYKLLLSGAKRDSFLNLSVDSFTVNNLSKGDYRLTLFDKNGCTVQGCDFRINDPICNLVLTLTPTNNLCAGASQGSIQSSITGGIGPFSYDWSDNRFDGNPRATGLPSGNFQLIVTDAQLCRDTASVSITEPAQLETICSVVNQPSTVGGSDGRARVVIRGGSGQRNIQLSGPSPGQMQQSSVDTFGFSNLAAGNYSVRVSDANGCTDTCSFSLQNITCKLVGTAQGINPDCNGTATGSIRVTLTGNNGAVTYAWSNPALNGANPTALAAGTYTVTLTDAAACKDTLNVTLLNPTRLTLAAIPASQPTPARPTGGSIALTYAGGTPAYRINWSPNGSDQSIGNTGAFTISNLRAGAYTITLTDSNGCNAQVKATLSEPPCNLSINIVATRADCGSSHLNTTLTGNTGLLQYTWNVTRFNGQANPRNATPGTYVVTVTDAIGCSAKDSLVLAVDPSALIVSLGLINPLCPGDLGVFTLRNVTGGQGPFTLTLNNTIQRFNNPPLTVRNLNPGTFALNITNASGCSFDTTITIQSPRSLSLELGPDTTLRRGAKVTFKPQLNFNPSQISWSPPSGLTSAQSLNAQAEPAFTTTYTLQLSDSAGCKVSDKIQVLVAGQVEAYFPNAFSPNGDEVNDYFSGYGGDEIEALEYLRIFDRWGNLVFEGINIPVDDPTKGWDGTSRGQPSPIGLYVFSSVVRLKNGSTYSKAGEVNLVR
ncbi:gliding motility-associated C-terminal domain-containing protein [Haliscomenobacter sp.]|uniref:T9SS type B sorting domain-containing protein n=1 Tax=Haliscomenobacter sp. TaxID=2717303 RepID=UPI003BAABE9E